MFGWPSSPRSALAVLFHQDTKKSVIVQPYRFFLAKCFKHQLSFFPGAAREIQLVFETFCQEEAVWLDDYAFFRVLMEENSESATWTRWPTEHQSIKRARAWLHD